MGTVLLLSCSQGQHTHTCTTRASYAVLATQVRCGATLSSAAASEEQGVLSHSYDLRACYYICHRWQGIRIGGRVSFPHPCHYMASWGLGPTLPLSYTTENRVSSIVLPR